MLQIAGHIAQRGDNTLATKYWVAAVTAEAYAGIVDLAACQCVLNLAEEVCALKENSINGAWLRFDGERLPEQRGACFAKLQRPWNKF